MRASGSNRRTADKKESGGKKRTYLQELHRLSVSHLGLGPVHVKVQLSRVDALLGRHGQPPILRSMGKNTHKMRKTRNRISHGTCFRSFSFSPSWSDSVAPTFKKKRSCLRN